MQDHSVSVIPFSFESLPIRTIVIESEPWFVAKDVATALGYSDTDKGRNHCKRAKLLKAADLAGLDIPSRGMYIIPVGDVFRMAAKSQLESAVRFESWIFDEVLPSIQKTGSYGVPALPTDPLALFKLSVAALESQSKEIAEVRSDVQFLKDNVRLHQWQCYELKLAVTNKVNEFHKLTGVERKSLYSGMWNRLKLEMKVASYQAIPAAQFDAAVLFANSLTIKDMPDYVKAQALDLQGGAA